MKKVDINKDDICSSTVYQCICGTQYSTPKIVNDIISLVDEKNPVIELIIVCPGCKNKSVNYSIIRSKETRLY